jgi:nitroreductase
MINLNKTEIINSIEHSQHCQRNWDLTKSIPEEHIDLLIEAVKRAPSKQNIAFYKTHFITDRSIIEAIANNTKTNPLNRWTENNNIKDAHINSQALANLLIVFELYEDYADPNIHNRNAEAKAIYLNHPSEKHVQILNNDRYTSIGIASGYVALIANMLGYATGFCACVQSGPISKILGTNNKTLLLLGVGFPKEGVPHTKPHSETVTYPYLTLSKQEIIVNRIP